MRIRDAFGIYHTLEDILKKSNDPKTCVDLFDDSEVKKFADSANRVSDYLGHMYRRGLLGREAAPKSSNSQARWAYFWKNRDEVKPPTQVIAPLSIVRESATASDRVTTSVTPAAKPILRKPNIEISDNGGTVVIELPQLTITIRSTT